MGFQEDRYEVTKLNDSYGTTLETDFDYIIISPKGSVTSSSGNTIPHNFSIEVAISKMTYYCNRRRSYRTYSHCFQRIS
jgi:phosphopantetheine adenylyltransferase